MNECKKSELNQIQLNKKEKYSWGLLFAFLIIISFVFIQNFMNTYQSMVQSGFATTENQVKIIQNQLYSLLDKKFSMLDYLVTKPEVRNMNKEELYSLFLTRAKSMGFEYLFVIDSNGRAYYINENVTKDHSGQDFFEAVMNNEHYVTAPYIHREGGDTIVTLSSSIYNYAGNKVGVLSGAVNIDAISELIWDIRQEMMH